MKKMIFSLPLFVSAQTTKTPPKILLLCLLLALHIWGGGNVLMGQTPYYSEVILSPNIFSVMLCENGTVQAVGGNQWGQLGNGTFDPSAFFTPVVGLDDVIQVSNAIDHTLALKCDGTVWAWGINSYGKVGSPILSASVNTPFQVPGITNAIKVSAGGYHSMALLADGTVLCWGAGAVGQLGNGAWADSYIPVVVTGLSNVIDISAGRLFSAALLNDGTVRTWGDNLWGQLGDGAWANSNIPVVVVGLTDVVKIATGETSAYSITTNEAIWAWGSNSAGQLGNGTTTDSNVPVQMLYSNSSYPIDIAACSIDCLILFDNGDIMACGDNTHCQFGADMPSNTLFPTLVLAATPFVDLVRSIAHLHVFGLTCEGAVYGWGRNMYGQIGLGTASNNICTPTLVDIVCTAKVPACFDIESFYCQNEAITLAPTPAGGVVTVIPPSNNALVLNATPYTFIPTETGAYTLVYEVETSACATEMVQISTFVAPCCPPPIDDTPDVIDTPQELACCLQNTNFLIHQNSNGLNMVYDNMAYTVQNSGTWSLGSNELETVFGASGGILRINTDIIIPADVEVMLENITFEFGPQGRIIVQRGGSLVLGGNAYMQGLCNSVWQGIQVEGPGWGNQRQVAPSVNYGRIYQTANSDFEIRDAIIAIAGMRLPLIDVNAMAFDIETALQLLNGTGIDLMPNLTSVFLKEYTNSATAQSTSGGVVYLIRESALNTNFQGINLSWFNNSDNAPGVPMMSECQQIQFIGNLLPYPFNVLPNVGIPISEVGIYAESYNTLRLYNENRFTRLKYGIRTFECNNWKIGGQYLGNSFETCNVGVSNANTLVTNLLGATSIIGNSLNDCRVGLQCSGTQVFIAHNNLYGTQAIYPNGGVQIGMFLQGCDYMVQYNTHIDNMVVGVALLNNGHDLDLVEENVFNSNVIGVWSLGDNDGTYLHCNQFVGYFYALLTQDYLNTWGNTAGLLGDQGICNSATAFDDPADNAFVNGLMAIRQTIAAPFNYFHRLGAGFTPNISLAPGAGLVTPIPCNAVNNDIVSCQTWRTIPRGAIAGIQNERYADKTLLQHYWALLTEEHDTTAALNLLNNIESGMARWMQMRFAVANGQFVHADSLHALLPNTNLDQEYQLQLALLYRQLAQSNRTWLQLTPEETAIVYNIANSNTPVAFEARCIRYLTHGEEYEVPLPPLPQEVLNGNWQTYINFKGANSNNAAMVGFYPNPANNLINIQYNASPNNTPAILEWYSATGKLIHNLSLPQAGNYTLNVVQWTNGLYFCKVIQNGNLISVQKVMIAR